MIIKLVSAQQASKVLDLTPPKRTTTLALKALMKLVRSVKALVVGKTCLVFWRTIALR